MADQKVSDLPSLSGVDVDAADLLYIIDSSAGSAGSKKITVGQYQLAPVSGGTANGVMYLDGSKVVTTGSALVFDGTNLGVGTSSPTTKLDVSSSGTTTLRVNRLGVADVYLTAGANGIYGLDTASTNLHFGVSNSLLMTLDGAGNLGLGVTPSAWLGSQKAIEVGGGFSLNASGPGNGASFTLTQNAFVDASSQWIYKFSSVPSARYDQSQGTHAWQTAPAGTAGNAISFTQAMTLTSGGDLLVGATSNTPANTTDVAFCAGSTTGYGSTWQQIPNNAPASYKAFTVFRGNVEIGSISYNGTGVNFNATSDRRLKENIAPAGDAGVVIDAIDIVQHDWKAGGHTRFGVIAQDLNEVAPEAVTAGDDNEEIERTWGVDYSKLVPMLIKEIQSLRARVAALESA